MQKFLTTAAMMALVLVGCGSPLDVTAIASSTSTSLTEPTVPKQAGTEAPRSQTSAALDSSAETAPPAALAIMDEWDPIYTYGAMLFETCIVMYQTQIDFGQGEIGPERARTELEVEAEFGEPIWRGITSLMLESEAAASRLIEIEYQAMGLIEILEIGEAEMGTAATVGTIEGVCGSMQERMNSLELREASA